MDRRVIRTREALQRALMTLIAERSYDDISVDDICRVAKVARSTFYTHYTGKDDLKRAGLETVATSFVSHGGSGSGGLAFSLPMFRHAQDHIHHYRAMKDNHGAAVALGTIRQMVTSQLRKELRTSSLPAGEREFATEYLAGAFMAVLAWWLEEGLPSPSEEMDRLYQTMSTGALAGVDRQARNPPSTKSAP